MTWRIEQHDVSVTPWPIEDESVQCVVTSPPYWGLRDYGVPGQIGLEPTPADYVEKIVSVFREVRRVLRKDGSVWLNLGDCYASNPASGGPQSEKLQGPQNATPSREYRRPLGLKPKDLVGIPWRVAFALQADGWWLRSDIVWAKPNPMPESIRDRPTRAHEYVFLLTKSRRYFYDADAIREPHLWANDKRNDGHRHTYSDSAKHNQIDPDRQRTKTDAVSFHPLGRNVRSVWTIATEPFPEAHFATFPTELARRCILAGTATGDLVLDPFSGAGTVALVADILGRDAVGLELNPEYVEMSRRRISAPRSEGEAERRGREDYGQMTWLDGTA